MFKKKQEKEKQEQELSIKEKMKVVDFMPNYAKEEACYKEAIITDVDTKRKTEWPRLKNGNEIAYENWLNRVINPETGEWFPKRDKYGNPVKNTGGRYLVSVITRIKVGRCEHLCSKAIFLVLMLQVRK